MSVKREEVEKWASGLSGETPRARLEVLRQIVQAAVHGENIGAATEALWGAAKRAHASSINGLTVQHGAAEALAAYAAHFGEVPLVRQLWTDERPAVREGAALGLSRVRGSRLGALLGVLAEGLQSENGAIVMCCIRALGNVVAEGGELGEALEPLKYELRRAGYPSEGWELGPSAISPRDLVEASPAEDAALVLAEYYLRRRDREALVELIEHDGPGVRVNAVAHLRRAAEGRDEVRRRWVEQTLAAAGVDT